MSDDPDLPDKPEGANGEETTPGGEGNAEASPAFGGLASSLDAFASIQRMLASIDFSAVEAAQRAIEGNDTSKMIAEAQEAIAKNFASSIDFSRIARPTRHSPTLQLLLTR